MKYTISHISKIIGGELQLFRDASIEHLLLDSRKIIFPNTSLFFALKSARRDGHQFTSTAYDQGVRNFVVSENLEFPEANIIKVSDTLSALQQLAAYHRQQFKLPIIAITGSNGKTVVKEWLNQLLEPDFDIARSPKSFNSQIGVPLSVWQLDWHHNLAIFEAGISQPGEMARLKKIIQPTLGIFTNIGEAHSSGFISQAQKISEKLLLFQEVDSLVYCLDHEELHSTIMAKRKSDEQWKCSLMTWSSRQDADFKVTFRRKFSHTIISGVYRDGQHQIEIPFTDDASIENAIHCWCILLQLNLDQHSIRERMKRLTSVAMRMELKKGINNCTIINDSYSADVKSLEIALDFLAQQKHHPRRTAILSDILQSGKNDAELYGQVARALKHHKIDRAIGVGNRISSQRQLFIQQGIEVAMYPSVDELLKNLPLLFRDETILLKGARVFEFERIDQALEQKIHQTAMEIDLNKLVHNLREFQGALDPTTRIMVMVKAFSYGSGTFEVASVLQYHKVNYLAVAYTDEGIELRRAGVSLPIMVMNTDESDFHRITEFSLEPELYSLEMITRFEDFLKREGILQYPVHLELETGMNRLGINKNELDDCLNRIASPSFKLQSVFTHLAASESASQDHFTEMQATLFREMTAEIQRRLSYPILRHVSNTAGVLRHPSLQFDMIRLGIGLYGIGDSKSLHLQQVATLKTSIAQIKSLSKEQTVSYGRSGRLLRDSLIATVRIGYADGYPRSLSNGRGKMWVKGQLAPVVGVICMDMTMIDITGIDGVQPGDEVIVFGEQLPVELVAEWAGTIPYEILTGISQRVKRVYYYE